jgi:hypothetical protein
MLKINQKLTETVFKKALIDNSSLKNLAFTIRLAKCHLLKKAQEGYTFNPPVLSILAITFHE